MRRDRSRSGSAKGKLPESLTQHLADPKIRVLRTPDGRRRPYRAEGRVKKVLVSIVTLTILILAGGHLAHAW